jgi:VanZ family protein
MIRPPWYKHNPKSHDLSNVCDKIQFMFASLKRWIPALIMMAVIFIVSSQPSSNLPNFDVLDKVVKKGGHAIGYGLLGLSYLYALGLNKKHYFFAWLLAILYAITDEFHQGFVSSRHPSVWDVMVFDNLGTIAALFLYYRKNGSLR